VVNSRGQFKGSQDGRNRKRKRPKIKQGENKKSRREGNQRRESW